MAGLTLTKQIGVVMDSQREKAIQKIIIFLKSRLVASSKKSLDDVLTLTQEHDILIEDVLKYWHEEALNV